MENLFTGLIASKTRIKLLIRFFFNPETRSYLRELAKEFNCSTNSVREELNQLTNTKLLISEKNGRQVMTLQIPRRLGRRHSPKYKKTKIIPAMWRKVWHGKLAKQECKTWLDM